MSHRNILETNVGNDKLWKPRLCMRIRVKFVIKQKGYEKQKSN